MPRKLITSDNAKEYQQRSVIARNENTKIREKIREEMNKWWKEHHKDLIDNTGILALSGDNNARNFMSKGIGLFEEEEGQTTAPITINIVSESIKSVEDIDELI